MPHEELKANHTQVTKAENCHQHGAQLASDEAAQNDKSSSGSTCCEKGMCKCMGGNCHNLSKAFDNKSHALSAVSTGSLVFAFENPMVDSALPNGLKRPPRA
jgi:hypothetical protein